MSLRGAYRQRLGNERSIERCKVGGRVPGKMSKGIERQIGLELNEVERNVEMCEQKEKRQS